MSENPRSETQPEPDKKLPGPIDWWERKKVWIAAVIGIALAGGAVMHFGSEYIRVGDRVEQNEKSVAELKAQLLGLEAKLETHDQVTKVRFEDVIETRLPDLEDQVKENTNDLYELWRRVKESQSGP